MDLNTILAKDITTLTDEEKAFVKTNVAQLTDEQKASHTAIIDEVTEKVVEEAPAVADVPVVETPVVEEPVVVETPVVAEEGKVEASEKVSSSSLVILREQAAAGLIAMAELKKSKMNAMVKELTFSEGNVTGKFMPKSGASLLAFMESLSDAQTAKFKLLVAELPGSTIFKEYGQGSVEAGSAQAEMETKTQAKMSENKGMTYGDAVKMVLSENEGLSERYNAEIAGGKVSA